MFLIGNHLISDELVKEYFACNLEACKGACCWEGDYGAPLLPEELEILDRIYEQIKPFLTPEGIEAIEQQGKYVYIESEQEHATTLVNNRACAYLTYDSNGIALCGIEQAHRAGATDFLKPISCHLYPVRTIELDGGDALNYDQWHICSAACTKGKDEKIPVYKFVKNALVRKYGQDFYDELDAMAEHVRHKKPKNKYRR